MLVWVGQRNIKKKKKKKGVYECCSVLCCTGRCSVVYCIVLYCLVQCSIVRSVKMPGRGLGKVKGKRKHVSPPRGQRKITDAFKPKAVALLIEEPQTQSTVKDETPCPWETEANGRATTNDPAGASAPQRGRGSKPRRPQEATVSVAAINEPVKFRCSIRLFFNVI